MENTFPIHIKCRYPHLIGEDEPRKELIYVAHCMLNPDDLKVQKNLGDISNNEIVDVGLSTLMVGSGPTLYDALNRLMINLKYIVDRYGEGVLFNARPMTVEEVEARYSKWRKYEI